MKKPWVTLALLGLIVVLAALLISEWGGDTGRGLASEPSAANPAKEQQPVSKIHDAGPSLREPQGQSELPAQSREEFLAAYWGDRWPLVRSGLSPEAVDTLGMPANNVGTWADVEQHFHEHLVTLMQGAEGIMADLFHIDHSNHELVALWDLYSDRDITSEELSLLQEVRKPYQERLHELIARCLGEERICRESMWARGLYSTGPYFNEPLPPQSETPLYQNSGATNHKGWSFEFAVLPEHCPEWKAALEELSALSKRYNQDLRDSITLYAR